MSTYTLTNWLFKRSADRLALLRLQCDTFIGSQREAMIASFITAPRLVVEVKLILHVNISPSEPMK